MRSFPQTRLWPTLSCNGPSISRPRSRPTTSRAGRALRRPRWKSSTSLPVRPSRASPTRWRASLCRSTLPACVPSLANSQSAMRLQPAGFTTTNSMKAQRRPAKSCSSMTRPPPTTKPSWQNMAPPLTPTSTHRRPSSWKRSVKQQKNLPSLH
ncbi:hypothetical protein D9M68_918400 [compost metagenome]